MGLVFCVKTYHTKMSSSSSSSDQRKVSNKKNRHCYTFENDEYSVERLFEAGSVVHNREWCYVVDQAAAVEVAVLFKARCTFSVNGEGCCRVLKIVDDTGYTHGELELFIKPGKASVKATPYQMEIEKKERTIRLPQKLRTDCKDSETVSSDYTEVKAEETFKVKRSEKLAAQAELDRKVKIAGDNTKSQFSKI